MKAGGVYTLGQKMMAHCECYVDVLQYIPIVDLANIIHEYCRSGCKNAPITIKRDNEFTCHITSSSTIFGRKLYSRIHFNRSVPYNSYKVILVHDSGTVIHNAFIWRMREILFDSIKLDRRWSPQRRISFKAEFMRVAEMIHNEINSEHHHSQSDDDTLHAFYFQIAALATPMTINPQLNYEAQVKMLEKNLEHDLTYSNTDSILCPCYLYVAEHIHDFKIVNIIHTLSIAERRIHQNLIKFDDIDSRFIVTYYPNYYNLFPYIHIRCDNLNGEKQYSYMIKNRRLFPNIMCAAPFHHDNIAHLINASEISTHMRNRRDYFKNHLLKGMSTLKKILTAEGSRGHLHPDPRIDVNISQD